MEFIGKVVSRTQIECVGNLQMPTFSFMVDEVNPLAPEHPQRGVFKCLGKNAEGIYNSLVRDRVIKVHFNLSGRAWNGKLYGENICWKISDPDNPSMNMSASNTGQGANGANAQAGTQTTGSRMEDPFSQSNGQTDVPF